MVLRDGASLNWPPQLCQVRKPDQRDGPGSEDPANSRISGQQKRPTRGSRVGKCSRPAVPGSATNKSADRGFSGFGSKVDKTVSDLLQTSLKEGCYLRRFASGASIVPVAVARFVALILFSSAVQKY